MKGVQYFLIVLTNGVVACVLFFFQFLMFSFLPATDPHTSQLQQKTAALNFVLGKDVILILELIVGAAVCFMINKKVLKLSVKTSMYFAVGIFLIFLAFIVAFSLNYINKFK